jgi:hypothetical protein
MITNLNRRWAWFESLVPLPADHDARLRQRWLKIGVGVLTPLVVYRPGADTVTAVARTPSTHGTGGDFPRASTDVHFLAGSWLIGAVYPQWVPIVSLKGAA